MFSRWIVLILLFAASSRAATISVTPSLSNVQLGQSFSVGIAVTGVADLFAYQFDIGFDQTVLTATGVTEGAFLGAGGATFFISGNIDNASGLIGATANSLLGAVPGVTGSGELARITFTVVGGGSSAVNILNATLLDSSLSGIELTVQNGTVSTGAAGIPEPSALELLGAALLLQTLRGVVRRKMPRMSFRGTAK